MSYKVIFADTNQEILDILCYEAKKRNWIWDTAVTVNELFLKLNHKMIDPETAYDLVVSDMYFQNSGIDGLTVLSQIRRKFPDLPFIFFSPVLEALTITEAKKLEATDIVERPMRYKLNQEIINSVFTRFEQALEFTSRNFVKTVTSMQPLVVPQILTETLKKIRSTEH